MNLVFLQLGSNLGDREKSLINSTFFIEEKVGKVLEKSNVYESTSWRVEGQANYLNQVLKVESKLNPHKLLAVILDIEKNMGRIRLEKWGERLIDIDIIFYNNDIIESAELCIPHKYMHERMFVLLPLHEIAPHIIHPKYNKTVDELLKSCTDKESVILHEL